MVLAAMCLVNLNRKVACPLFLCVALAVTGCVTQETYKAQVIRTNNFQRQLAEEEKRSADLTAEIARLKNQVAELEAQNRALTAQLKDAKAQVVRSLEEVGRLQDEIKQARAAAVAPLGAAAPISRARGVSPSSTEPPDRLDELKEDGSLSIMKSNAGSPSSASPSATNPP
jgi:septal ring factor EnvC (AmiA/AmiB activator)